WRLIITITLVYLMFAHIRFEGLFAIVAPLLIIFPLTEQFPFLRLTEQIRSDPRFFETIALFSHRFFFPTCVLVVGGVVAFGSYRGPMAPAPNITPAGAVNYLEREHLTGNIYNPHSFGGYLISRGVKTFMDGRNDQLFSSGFVTRLHNIIER